AASAGPSRTTSTGAVTSLPLTRSAPLAGRLTDADLAAHATFVATLGGTVVWREYVDAEEPGEAVG
ncbi:MAG: hypothetical protein ACRCU1_05120, partial [Alsobacter sp.]